MWTYKQSTGELFSANGLRVGRGYSGHGAGVNNHAMEADAGVGPIPCGKYTIGPAHHDDHTGPITMNLDPVAPFNALGRSLFRMHGDNTADNESASRGCIIMPPGVRTLVSNSQDRILEVVQ